MWSGAIVWVQPRRLPTPCTVITFEPIPSIGAPIETSIRARSWTWGSEAALRITVGPRVSAAAISAFSVAITDGSSIRKSQGRRPVGAWTRMLSCLWSTVAPERAERVEVRIEPAPADHVAARRRHHARGRSVPAAGRPAGTRPGSARPGRGRPRDGSTSRAVDRQLARTEPLHARAESLEQQRHRLDVADPRDVAEDHLVVGQQAGSQDRQRAVLVTGGHDRA